MKIFALNLCLEFLPVSSISDKKNELITFPELMNELFKGEIPEGKQFFIKVEDQARLLDDVVEFQTHEVWRMLDVMITFVFDSPSRVDQFVESFMDRFSNVDAAGGIVRNEKNELLVIFHRERWSLPKGGVEWLENPEDAAIREVKEETGVQDLALEGFIEHTFHTFRKNKKWLLKKTYWYLMRTDSSQELVPQEEEQITDIRWVNQSDWNQLTTGAYPQIRYLLEKALRSAFPVKNSEQ